MSVLTSVAAFLVAIAILVAIHEFGHYWVAKKMGVKVLRFSIGFGKPLYTRRAGPDDTEYVLAAIPLGGYVKMLDEREGEVPADELDRTFNRASVYKRIAIVAAGPLFNFLFAIIAYAAMYMVGVNGIKPVIGAVTPSTVAASAGIQAQSEILAVNGRETPSWEVATLAIINEALDNGRVELQLAENGGTATRVLDLQDTRALLGEGDVLDHIGLQPWRPQIPAVLGRLIDTGAAAKAGLQTGDRLLSIDTQPMQDWRDVVDAIRANPERQLALVIERDGSELAYTLSPDAFNDNGETVGRIGAMPQVDEQQMTAMQVTVRHGPIEAVMRGLDRTWSMSVLTLRVMWKMVTGEASLKNISGPLTIAEYAGVSAVIGLAAFLSFLGIVSVSLGVLNLLPVPVLDGGHLLYYFIELLKGSPLSEATEAFGQRVGLTLLGCLMFIAFYNDITRLLG